VQNEVRHHAWRMARLKRMRELALEKKNDKLVAKIDRLEQKENTRHERAMAREKMASLAGTAGSAAMPVAEVPMDSARVGGLKPPHPAPTASTHEAQGGRP
jgi:hypothetical protein